jgi:hypothetical protein
MLTRENIIETLREAAFDRNEYWVAAGAAMVLYGIKDTAGDIDLGCTSRMADRLEKEGYETQALPDGSRRIVFSESIELFENWIEGQAVFQEGLPVVSAAGLARMKEKLGREKDREDIILIKEYLSKC